MRAGSRGEKRAKLPIAGTLRLGARVCRRRWRFLLTIGLAVGIPIGFFDALAGSVEEVDAETTGEALGIAGTALGGFAIVLIAGQLLEGVIGEAALEVKLGHERPSLARIARHLPCGGMILVNLLYVTGTVVGLLLLVVPGVVFFTWYAPAIALIALERDTVRATFKRSRELVLGSFWRVLLLTGGAYLLTAAIGDSLQTHVTGELGEGFLVEWGIATASEALLTTAAALVTVVVVLELIELRGEPLPEPI
jgi:hypothetical protein